MDTIEIEVLNQGASFKLFARPSKPGTRVFFKNNVEDCHQLKVTSSKPSPLDEPSFVIDYGKCCWRTVREEAVNGIYLLQVAEVGKPEWASTFQLAVDDSGDDFAGISFDAFDEGHVDFSIIKQSAENCLEIVAKMPVVNAEIVLGVDVARVSGKEIKIPAGETRTHGRFSLADKLSVSLPPSCESGGTKTIDIIVRPPRAADEAAAD